MEVELEKEKQSKETIIATYQEVLQVLLGKLKDEEKKRIEEEEEVKKLREILKNIEQEKEKQNEKIIELNQQLNAVKEEIHQLKQESISTLLSHTEESEKIGQEIKTQMIKLQQQVESVQCVPQKSQVLDNIENSVNSNTTKPFSYTLYNKYDYEEFSGGCRQLLTVYEYNQFYYEKMKDLDIFEGYLTPTTVVTPSEGNPEDFKDILEIRYAQEMQFNSVLHPKAYFFKNKNKSCYLFIRFEEKILSVIYGIRELNIIIGECSFLVYEVSSDLDSFTDNTDRLIYVDRNGIYIVSKEENSLETVVKRYREKGILQFEGLIITISALNGAIMFNNQCLFSKHFYNIFNENRIGINTEFVPSKDPPIKEQYLKNFYGSCFSNYCNRKSINRFINSRINNRKK